MILSDKISPGIHLITESFKMLNKASSKTKVVISLIKLKEPK